MPAQPVVSSGDLTAKALRTRSSRRESLIQDSEERIWYESPAALLVVWESGYAIFFSKTAGGKRRAPATGD
ncbi:MAG: hypothetical protein EAZ96_08410 [Oscillatoriales cyanobacterium]|nr:MAG: hypothetical protein EAZ96_08410 [Oscillatoriales cyanobacterium]